MNTKSVFRPVSEVREELAKRVSKIPLSQKEICNEINELYDNIISLQKGKQISKIDLINENGLLKNITKFNKYKSKRKMGSFIKNS